MFSVFSGSQKWRECPPTHCMLSMAHLLCLHENEPPSSLARPEELLVLGETVEETVPQWRDDSPEMDSLGGVWPIRLLQTKRWFHYA